MKGSIGGNTVPVAIGVAALVLGTLGLSEPSQAALGSRPFGDVKVLAKVPTPPGWPEGIAWRDGKVYVAGPARVGTILGVASRVLQFDRQTGQLTKTYPTVGENKLAEHANSSIAFDGNGRLYVLNTQIGMYRLNVETGAQESYSAPFPNLPTCLLQPNKPCSPTLLDLPALPNDLAFAPDGSAYVTDSMQATIWRVPPGGGAPQIWFQDDRFASPYIGVNGIRLNPDRTHVYVTVSTDMLGRGFIYTLPLVAQPQAADLQVFHAFNLGDSPDGIAFGNSGNLYVALALPTSSGMAILDANGNEVHRLVNPLLSPVAPYDGPANFAFDGQGSVLVSNHAGISNLPTSFKVLDVWVDDTASPLEEPLLP